MPTLANDILTAVVVFAATNLDDAFLLLAFFADPRHRAAPVIAGQYLGIAVLFGASVAASLICLVIAPSWLGLLGLIPLGLGIKALFEQESDADESPVNRGQTIFTVAAITVANGGDNVGIYTPLFATLSLRQIAVTGLVFIVLIAAWCELARRMVRHHTWASAIRRYSARLLPFVFIGLGVWIILKMGTPAALMQRWRPG
jgi:cadmium resistance transport/sequestration family protein